MPAVNLNRVGWLIYWLITEWAAVIHAPGHDVSMNNKFATNRRDSYDRIPIGRLINARVVTHWLINLSQSIGANVPPRERDREKLGEITQERGHLLEFLPCSRTERLRRWKGGGKWKENWDCLRAAFAVDAARALMLPVPLVCFVNCLPFSSFGIFGQAGASRFCFVSFVPFAWFMSHKLSLMNHAMPSRDNARCVSSSSSGWQLNICNSIGVTIWQS